MTNWDFAMNFDKSKLTYVYRTLTHINTCSQERTRYYTCTITERHTDYVLGVGVGLSYQDAQLSAELHASCALARAVRDSGELD